MALPCAFGLVGAHLPRTREEVSDDLCPTLTIAPAQRLSPWSPTGQRRPLDYVDASGQAAVDIREVANRPGRIEPRVLKRRRHRYPLMQRPRDQLRLELGKT